MGPPCYLRFHDLCKSSSVPGGGVGWGKFKDPVGTNRCQTFEAIMWKTVLSSSESVFHVLRGKK